MIDTLKIILDDSLISSKNKLIIIPASIEAATGVLNNNRFLFIDTAKNKFYGSKAIYNDEKIQVTIISKYDLLKETKDRNLEFDSFDEGNTKIICQLSLPKFFNGNNFKATDLYNLKKHLKQIETYLKTIGIYTNILNANLSRLDSFLNLKIKYSFKTYNQLLSNLKLSRLKNFEYAGTTFLYRNTQHQICIYDKLSELKNQNIELKIDGNYLRIENRLLKKKKILDSLGYFKLKDMPERLSEIKTNYRETISKKLFSTKVDEFNNRFEGIMNVKKLTKENIEDYLLKLKKEKGRNYLDNFIKNVGIIYLNQYDKIDNLSDAVEGMQTNRMQKNRIMNKMNEYRKSSILFEKNNNVLNKNLYIELEDKFNTELDKIDL